MTREELMTLVNGAQSASDLVATLTRKGIDKALHFFVLRSYFSSRAREKGIPLSGQFELTPLCNLDCKMCYVHLSNDQFGKQRRLLTASEWECIMGGAIDSGLMFANMTGGECLTYPQFDRLYLYLHAHGIEVSVLTNGVLLDDARIDFFRRHPPSAIQVTLYGANEDMYERVTGRRAFRKVLDNLLRANEAKLPLVIGITPNPFLSLAEIEATLRMAADLSIPFRMNVSLLTPGEETGRSGNFSDLSVDAYIELLKIQRKLKGLQDLEGCAYDLPPAQESSEEAPRGVRCGGGRSSFLVKWDGTLHPCQNMHVQEGRPLENGFNVAWEVIHRQAQNYPLPVECEHCAYRGTSGCPAQHNMRAGHANLDRCEWCQKMVNAGLAQVYVEN